MVVILVGAIAFEGDIQFEVRIYICGMYISDKQIHHKTFKGALPS
jgi:hypothetical protein